VGGPSREQDRPPPPRCDPPPPPPSAPQRVGREEPHESLPRACARVARGWTEGTDLRAEPEAVAEEALEPEQRIELSEEQRVRHGAHELDVADVARAVLLELAARDARGWATREARAGGGGGVSAGDGFTQSVHGAPPSRVARTAGGHVGAVSMRPRGVLAARLRSSSRSRVGAECCVAQRTEELLRAERWIVEAAGERVVQ
jgi:hypothetical protein